MDCKKYKHPSYGMISASKVSCSHDKNFYGAETKHNNFIVLEVYTSDVTRDLNKNWYYADNKIIQVALTPLQWAELLTCMNTTGVPCTLEWIKGEGSIESPPELQDKIDLHKMEFQNYTKETLDSVKSALSELESCIDSGKGKRALREQLDILKVKTRNLEPNLKFAEKQFDEHINKVVTESKQKIESAIEHRIITLGKEVLGNELRQLSSKDISEVLIENKGE